MKTSIKYKYLFLGIGIGCLFPIVSILMDCCILNNGSFSFLEIGSYYRNNPVHFLVSTAPIFLGITLFIAGINAQKQYETVRQLKRVNENLQTTNEALDSFNYYVSHDLKTVLSNTESLALMLKKYVGKNNPEKVDDITDRILRISLNGQDTVRSFLAFSKATSFIFEENQTLIKLKSEIEEIRDNHFRDDVLKVTVRDTDFKAIKIDRKALESLILNLLSNSVKYNSNQVAIVDIELKNIKGFHQLIYKDNGIGIDLEKNQHKLFKPFEKIKGSKEVEGTGVGLYLVKKIMTAYGGEISIESKLSVGTTFTLSFPKLERI